MRTEMATLGFTERTSFSTVCKVLEEISKVKNRTQKADIMHKFISSFYEQSKKYEDENFYPIMRLLLPQLERERGSYGIKQHTLAKTYIRILCLSNQSKDAQKMMNYRTPTSSDSSIGDFADVVFWILKSRFSGGGSLTVHEVNLHLDNIATKHAEHDPRGVDAELQTMILHMLPIEQKWLIRILLKDLHLGLSQSKILSVFHRDANDLYDVTNNLKKICYTLKDPSIRLNEIGVDVFQPFKPMLCQQCDVKAVNTDIKKAEAYYVETKFDGERFQLHLKDEEFKYFSRNGHEFTDTYGCNSWNGVLTPKIVTCLNPRVKSCILDGEMMCWNTKKKCYTTKGMNIDVKHLKAGHINQPCFCVFDILLLNSEVLTNKPLVERFKILEEIIQPQEGVIMISAKEVVNTESAIMKLLNQAIKNSEEGIVVKDPASVYKFNARNAGWYKIKPEYTEGMMVELDLLIIGGYYGQGRRRGIISQFLLGIADNQKNENNEPKTFYAMGRVGSGYSDDELEELICKLEKSWKRTYGTQKPPGIEWTKEKPDLWIRPCESFILQVKATELMPSDSFPVGLTLRFPRVQKIRYDKPWYDCLTVDEFTTLRQANCGKLTAGYATKLNEDSSTKKKVIKRTLNAPTLDENCLIKKVRNDEIVSKLFKGKEMCVLSGLNDEMTKSEIERKIMLYGGTVVQHPGGETFCVIASENNVRVANVARLNKYDIVKPTWLFDCIDGSALRKWRRDDVLGMTASTSESFLQEYDSFGDSYTERIDKDDLEQLLDSVNVDADSVMSLKDVLELDREIFGSRNPFAIFRGCSAYFYDVHEDVYWKYEVAVLKAMFRFHDGVIQSMISDSTTHVIVFGSSELHEEMKSQVASNKIRVVDGKWITESWNARCLLRTSKFERKVEKKVKTMK